MNTVLYDLGLCLFVGPQGGSVLQHQATDQTFGRDSSAFWRTGGEAAIPVSCPTLQRKYRGQVYSLIHYILRLVWSHRLPCCPLISNETILDHKQMTVNAEHPIHSLFTPDKIRWTVVPSGITVVC